MVRVLRQHGIPVERLVGEKLSFFLPTVEVVKGLEDRDIGFETNFLQLQVDAGVMILAEVGENAGRHAGEALGKCLFDACMTVTRKRTILKPSRPCLWHTDVPARPAPQVQANGLRVSRYFLPGADWIAGSGR